MISLYGRKMSCDNNASSEAVLPLLLSESDPLHAFILPLTA